MTDNTTKKRHHIVIIGPPGAGKGTQSKFIESNYNILQLSTGDLLREIMTKTTDFARSIKKIVDSGSFIDDETILTLIKEQIADNTKKKSFLFDGYPRNLAQAEGLDKLLTELNQPISVVLVLDIDTDLLLSRIINRFTCKNCNQVYNKLTALPKTEGICDVCGSCEFIFRKDDDNETFKKRLSLYDSQTKLLIDYYKSKNLVKTINASSEIENISSEIAKTLASFGYEKSEKS